MNHLDVLVLPRDPTGKLPPLNPVLLHDETEAVLVDCGCTGFLPLVESAAKAKGVDLARLTRVFITHHDHDHMGALAALKRTYPRAQVLASAEDAPYIQGERKFLRLVQAEALFDSLPEDKKIESLRLQQTVAAVEPVRVDATVADGQVFPWCGGIEVVATPGHMPGHISLYARESRTLIAGDALTVVDGRLAPANPRFTLDPAQARASMRKLLDYDIIRLVCYHGGVVEGDIRQALRDALEA
ncbi:MAG: MBL fold metallo-hydrolase [Humidesulfovibrio sp.]|nr:MBL fold metallo-hydrolase [Humidesulfovibrio sp.]